jgi:hypothetical protein
MFSGIAQVSYQVCQFFLSALAALPNEESSLVFFTKYFLSNKSMEDEIGVACSKRVIDKKIYSVFHSDPRK